MPGLVSIIISLYNYEDYISECLDSCLAQTYKNIEIIVVDDCSTDFGPQVVEHYHENEKSIHFVELGKNLGYSKAKNEGVVCSRGDFIVLIDADDKLTKDSIERRLAVFNRFPEVQLVHGTALRWYGGNETRGFNPKTYCHAQGRMYRRGVYSQYGLYYEPLRSMSDKEFIYRLGVHPESPLPRKIKDKKISDVVALYRKHDLAMHKQRRLKPKYNEQIKKTFKRRIKQLRREGITKENTRFL